MRSSPPRIIVKSSLVKEAQTTITTSSLPCFHFSVSRSLRSQQKETNCIIQFHNRIFDQTLFTKKFHPFCWFVLRKQLSVASVFSQSFKPASEKNDRLNSIYYAMIVRLNEYVRWDKGPYQIVYVLVTLRRRRQKRKNVKRAMRVYGND